MNNNQQQPVRKEDRSNTMNNDTPSALKQDNLSSLDKALFCMRWAIDKKSEGNRILHLSPLTSFTDYFVICSAQSERQVQSIADTIAAQMKNMGYRSQSVEGYGQGRWVLVDFGDVIVHIFLEALRDYYRLEELWSAAKSVAIPPDFYTSAPNRPSPAQ